MKPSSQKILEAPATAIFIIILLTVFVYSFMLGGEFKTLDDQMSIIDNKLIRSFANVNEIFRESFFGEHSYYRPMVTLAYTLEYALWGLNPFFFNLFNLILHALTAVAVYGLVFELSGQKKLSSWSAVLFAIHPLQWECVSNIAGISIVLCALFFILSFYFYLRHVRCPQNSGLYILSILCFGLSLLSKESAGTLPMVIFSYSYFFSSGATVVRLKKAFWRCLPFVAVAAAYLILRRELGITNIAYWPSWHDLVLGVLTFLRGMVTWLRLFIFPVDLHFDRALKYFTHFSDPQIGFVFTALALTVLVSFTFRNRWSPLVKFSISWFLINLLTVSQVFPIVAHWGYAAMADHFLYLPSVGVFIILVIYTQRLLDKGLMARKISPAAAVWVPVGFSIFFLLTTIQQNIISSQQIAMFEQSLRYNPLNTRIRNAYALALAQYHLFDEAEMEFRKVLEHDPFDARARIGLGKSLCDQNKCWDAVLEYEKVIFPGKEEELLKHNLRLTYDIVIAQYQKMVAENRHNPALYYSLGVVYSKSGRYEEAIKSYQDCLSIDANHMYDDLANFNLGSTYGLMGNREKAIEHFAKVIAQDIGDDELHNKAHMFLQMLYNEEKQ